MRGLIAVLLLMWVWTPVRAETLPPAAQALLDRAKVQNGRRVTEAMALSPQVLPSSDGRAFLLVWRPTGSPSGRWVATLHGHASFATDELALWQRFLAPRGIGLVALQWWVGSGETPRDYLSPEQIYREFDLALKRLGAVPGSVLLHGFSRGSANVYAVAALDSDSRNRFFSVVVANAGGAMRDYPPTRRVADGGFGQRPFAGQNWVTVCGGRDPNPTRDGCPAMRDAAQLVRSLGGDVVVAIEDPSGDHGVFHRTPAYVERVLDLFAARQ